jgi:hypothetical protein
MSSGVPIRRNGDGVGDRLHAGFVAVVQVRFFGDDEPDGDGEDADLGPHSTASVRARLTEPALAGPYAMPIGLARSPLMLEMLMMRPPSPGHHRGIDRLGERHRGEAG